MGKAILFNGVVVATPIQTVSFVTPLVTGADYVNQYALLAAAVTAPQKTNLTTFIDTLIANSLWDKVHKCYPMLGGMAGYKVDVKDLKNQVNWSLPMQGTTWDSIRNAPYTNPIGNEQGIILPITTIDEANFCLIYSAKQRDNGSRYPFRLTYSDNTFAELQTQSGGFVSPSFNTPPITASLNGYSTTQSNTYLLNYTNNTGSFKVKSGNGAVLDVGVATPIIKQISSIRLYGVFQAERAAPADGANYGNINMCVVCNTGLTNAEMGIIANAINTFNESCGRNTAW